MKLKKIEMSQAEVQDAIDFYLKEKVFADKDFITTGFQKTPNNYGADS